MAASEVKIAKVLSSKAFRGRKDFSRSFQARIKNRGFFKIYMQGYRTA